MIRFVALACAGLAMLFSPLSAWAGEALSQSELRQLFPGHFTAVVQGYTVQISAKGNGVLIGQVKGYKDQGRWSLSGGKLCITMASFTGGKPSCSMVVADGGWYRGRGVKFRKL
jgi:hypothetical protein